MDELCNYISIYIYILCIYIVYIVYKYVYYIVYIYIYDILTAQEIELLQAGNISKRIDAMLKNLVLTLRAIRTV